MDQGDERDRDTGADDQHARERDGDGDRRAASEDRGGAAGESREDEGARAGDERAGANVQETAEKRTGAPERPADAPQPIPGLTAPFDYATGEEEDMERPVGMTPGGGGPAEEADMGGDDGDRSERDGGGSAEDGDSGAEEDEEGRSEGHDGG